MVSTLSHSRRASRPSARLSQSDHLSRSEPFDIILMTDMTAPGDLGLRIAQEIRTYSEGGYRIGLIHLALLQDGVRVAPDVQRCVRKGVAEVIAPSEIVSSALLIDYAPQLVRNSSAQFMARAAKVFAETVILVADQLPDYDVEETDWLFSRISNSVSWAPTNRWIRAALEASGPAVRLHPENWRAVGELPTDLTRPAAVDPRPKIGRVSGTGSAQWPASKDELDRIFPTDGSFDIYLLGRPPEHLLPKGETPPNWTMFEDGAVAVEWFLRTLDAFVYFPGADIPEMPEAAIAASMAAGKLVVLPPRLWPHFGPGPLYVAPQDAREAIIRHLGDPAATSASRKLALSSARDRFSAEQQRNQVTQLIGPRPAPQHAAAECKRGTHPSAQRQRERRPSPHVLFLASNGVGLGHVIRLLAIARRANGRFKPVFVTMAQAVHIIEAFGYVADYIPSQMYLEVERSTWDAWFEVELGQAIDRFEASLVVFDGNNPTPGLIRAVAARGNCKLAWIRQGMAGNTVSPFIENSRFCDLIIEPGEVASEGDFGVTLRRRHEATLIKPILLLEEDERLSRQEAAAVLELDETKPAVLIHLGAGSNRDILSIIDTLVGELKKFRDLQIVIAEWAIGPTRLSLWPEAKTIRGFPISQYFSAFDFSIAAAGYNTFHEVISYELPTIFIANTHPSMDDQAGRAKFAQSAGAAVQLPEDRLFELSGICEVLLNPRARHVVRENCRRIRQENGALDAANALAQLVHA